MPHNRILPFSWRARVACFGLCAKLFPIRNRASSAVLLGKLARNRPQTSSELESGLQWNILILSARPTLLSVSSLMSSLLHFLEQTGLHVENEAAHGDVFGDPGM